MAPVSALLTDSMALIDHAFTKRESLDDMRLTASEAFSHPSQCWNYWGCKVVIIVGGIVALLVLCKSLPLRFQLSSAGVYDILWKKEDGN